MNNPVWDYIEAHHDALVRYAASRLPSSLRDSAEDAVQQVVWKSRKSEVAPQAIPNFVFRAVLTTCIDIIRAHHDRPCEIFEDSKDWDGGIEAVDMADAVDRLIANLPDHHRRAVLLDAQGLTSKECAAVSGISESAHKSRLNRGRNYLQRHEAEVLL